MTLREFIEEGQKRGLWRDRKHSYESILDCITRDGREHSLYSYLFYATTWLGRTIEFEDFSKALFGLGLDQVSLSSFGNSLDSCFVVEYP